MLKPVILEAQQPIKSEVLVPVQPVNTQMDTEFEETIKALIYSCIELPLVSNYVAEQLNKHLQQHEYFSEHALVRAFSKLQTDFLELADMFQKNLYTSFKFVLKSENFHQLVWILARIIRLKYGFEEYKKIMWEINEVQIP